MKRRTARENAFIAAFEESFQPGSMLEIIDYSRQLEEQAVDSFGEKLLTNLVLPGKMSWSRLVEVMTVNPRRCLRLPEIRVEAGSTADLTLIDPAAEVTVSADWLQSRSKNSAWLGQTLTGCASHVFVAGRHTLTDGVVTPVKRVLR